MLEGDLEESAVFKDLGVRIVQPTYNVRNLMGDGCIEKADGGLSKMGYDFVAEMNRLKLLLDLSHAGPRTIAEGIAASKVSDGDHPHRLPCARGSAPQHPRF